MVHQYKSFPEVLKIMSKEEYIDLCRQLSEKIKEIRKDDTREGSYATLMRAGRSNGDDLYMWVEMGWKIEEVGGAGPGIHVKITNMITADSKEELFGSELIQDRFNELKTQEGFEKII